MLMNIPEISNPPVNTCPFMDGEEAERHYFQFLRMNRFRCLRITYYKNVTEQKFFLVKLNTKKVSRKIFIQAAREQLTPDR